MKRSDTPPPDEFRRAAALEARAGGSSRGHADVLGDLVSLGDFLAPEMHRAGGIDEAASAVREWADDDVAMIEEAETIAWDEHRDYSAEILHRARLLAAVTRRGEFALAVSYRTAGGTLAGGHRETEGKASKGGSRARKDG